MDVVLTMNADQRRVFQSCGILPTRTYVISCHTEGLQVAPLSTKAVLSSLPSQSSSISRVMSQENHVPNAALRENDNIDELSIVQIGSVTPYAFKNSPIEMQQAFQMHGMPGDHAHHMEGVDEMA